MFLHQIRFGLVKPALTFTSFKRLPYLYTCKHFFLYSVRICTNWKALIYSVHSAERYLHVKCIFSNMALLTSRGYPGQYGSQRGYYGNNRYGRGFGRSLDGYGDLGFENGRFSRLRQQGIVRRLRPTPVRRLRRAGEQRLRNQGWSLRRISRGSRWSLRRISRSVLRPMADILVILGPMTDIPGVLVPTMDTAAVPGTAAVLEPTPATAATAVGTAMAWVRSLDVLDVLRSVDVLEHMAADTTDTTERRLPIILTHVSHDRSSVRTTTDSSVVSHTHVPNTVLANVS